MAHTVSESTVISRSLKVEDNLKLPISQSKFSGPRKFTLRYQDFEITRVDILRKYEMCIHYMYILQYKRNFEILVFETSNINCILL